MAKSTEIEVKVLDVDSSKLEQKLIALGGTHLFKGRIRDWQFDHNDRALRDSDRLLRLRQTGNNKLEIVYKGPRGDARKVKMREEISVMLETHEKPEDVTELLESLGFIEAGHQEKDRISYRVEDVIVEIDQYPHIPPYVEIEGPDEAAIETMIKALDLEKSERSTLSADEVFKRYHPLKSFTDLRFK